MRLNKIYRKTILGCILTLLIFVSSLSIVSAANDQESGNVEPNSTDDIFEGSESFEEEGSEFAETEDIDEKFYKAKVIKIVEEKDIEIQGDSQKVQVVKVKLMEGPEKDKEVDIEYGSVFAITDEQKLAEGDTVVVSQTIIAGESTYFIEDKYRINSLLMVLLVFVLIILAFGRMKGLTSIFGLGFSLLVLIKFIVPQIIAGNNPLIISFVGSVAILVVSLYLAHGFNKLTSYAVLSSMLTLIIAFAVAMAFVFFTDLTGTGGEGAFILQASGEQSINLRGLLLGAIIIGALGVLDDVTVGQTMVVNELKEANDKLSVPELYLRALKVGREHVASMVNTLVLAYAGTALPLFILFTQNSKVELWVTINSEFVAEEIIRALVGSIALALAVPISTFIAVMFIKKQTKVSKSNNPTRKVQMKSKGIN